MKITRKELRAIIAEAGSFEYAGGPPNPLSTADVMDRLRQGEDVAGVEASGVDMPDMSYQANEYIPTIKRAHSIVKGLKVELDKVRFGNADETALIRNEIADALTSLENILKA
ncbi:hypothetical protein, partial [Limnobacter sp.]|uniref:hypothetical protein n=1 Tax=Limnobacter sp. TaxID=2003368 RepID=UPI00311FA0D1